MWAKHQSIRERKWASERPLLSDCCVHLRAETISAMLSVEVICCTPTLKELLKYTDAGNKKHKINDRGTAFPSS